MDMAIRIHLPIINEIMSEAISLHRNRTFTDRLIDAVKWFGRDARHYQIAFLSIFLFYGIGVLQWK
jgi:hypothetical protein